MGEFRYDPPHQRIVTALSSDELFLKERLHSKRQERRAEVTKCLRRIVGMHVNEPVAEAQAPQPTETSELPQQVGEQAVMAGIEIEAIVEQPEQQTPQGQLPVQHDQAA